MPLLSPRRYQPPFYPYTRDSLPVRAFTAFEFAIKDVLFGCRMCGNCILQETALICPMTCPKGLRNGPCGGSTPEHCYVDTTRPCTWYEIYRRAEAWGRTDILLEVQAPLDGRKVGHETWLDLVRVYRDHKHHIHPVEWFTDRAHFMKTWNDFFYDVRQPDWWKGDASYHAPARPEPVSALDRHLRSGRFTVTAEIAPPLSVNTEPMLKKAHLLHDWVIASNFTDNASASPRMSSLASAVKCLEAGLEPVLQLQARDRTRYAIEAEALGAAALGVRNVLCLTGDHLRLGPGPTPKPDQNDMDALHVLWMLRRMRDDGIYLDGREIKTPPQFFLGAASSPYAALPRYEAIRVEKKVNAGAQFIQTQPVFDYGRFVEWLEAVDRRDVLDKVHIMPGIIPLKSARAAHLMADDVPGVVIPPEILRRMDNASDEKEEGVAIALEIIEKLRSTPGIHGMHIMAVHWEEIVPRLIQEAGLPKPVREDGG
jgi:methylenetetrahydrofolate reductase (NADPH)